MERKKKLKKNDPQTICPYCGSGETKILNRNRLSDTQYIDRLACGCCNRVFLDRHVNKDDNDEKR